MREDVRADDPYAWTRPRVPEGDPYIWMDIGQPPVAQPAPAASRPSRRASSKPGPVAPEPIAWSEPALAASANEAVEMWVELPAVAEPATKPARARRSRSRPSRPPRLTARGHRGQHGTGRSCRRRAEPEAQPVVVAVAEPAPEPVKAAPAKADPPRPLNRPS